MNETDSFGVFFRKSFFSWHKFLEVFTPTATHKKVIGFDTFAGFPSLAREDGLSVTLARFPWANAPGAYTIKP